MKQKILGIGSDLLILFMNHWALISIAVTLMSVGGYDTPHLFLWSIFFSVPACLYFLRRNVHNAYLFYVLHILVVVLVGNVPVSLGIKLILMVLTLFYVGNSVKTRLSEIEEETVFVPAFSVCLIGAASIVNEILIGKSWGKYYVLIFFVYIISYFFSYFIGHYLDFVSINKNSASNIPEMEIFLSGMKQTGIYIIGGVLVLLVSANLEWLSYFAGVIGNGLIVILRFLLSLLNDERPQTNTIPQEDGPGPGFGGLLEPGETHPFWIFLEKVATIVVCVGIVVLIAAALVKGYQYLFERFYAPRRKRKDILQTSRDLRENCEIETGTNNRQGLFSFLNNKEKIRKIYRKRMLKNKNNIIGDADVKSLEYITAKECCEKISAEHLKRIYEKARYSKEAISAEDVKLAKIEE